jgi:hypothetical protein
MVEIKEDRVLVFGHPYALAGVYNPDVDDMATYYPEKEIFVVGAWGYQLGKTGIEANNWFELEMTSDEFEEFFKSNFINK